MRRQQKAAPQPAELTALRQSAGMKPGANHRTWAKHFLSDPAALAQHGLPAPDNEQWPKREPQYRAIREKFPEFTWRAEERPDKFGRVRRFVIHQGLPTVRGVLPTLADLLLMDPSLADQPRTAVSAPAVGVRTTIGAHTMSVSDREETIPRSVARCLEDALNVHVARKTTSQLVRLDMAPMHAPAPAGSLPVYEVEASPGVSLALRLNPSLRNRLVPAMDAVMLPPRYASWSAAYAVFEEVGVPLYQSWQAIPENASRVYVSCEAGEVPEVMRRRLVTDPWVKKDIDFPISGGRPLSPHETVKSLCTEFPNGFAIKPTDGWGASDVCIYAPSDRGHSHTLAKVARVLESLKSDSTHVVQPFYKPREDADLGTVIWRVFAIRNSPTGNFSLVGGMWNGRTTKSLIVHGAEDAVFGPLYT